MTSLKFCSCFHGATGVASLRLCSSFLWSDWGDLAQIVLVFCGATGVTSLKFCSCFHGATGVASLKLCSSFLWSDWGDLAQILF